MHGFDYKNNFTLYSFTTPHTMFDVFPIELCSNSLLILFSVKRWLFHTIAHAAEQY